MSLYVVLCKNLYLQIKKYLIICKYVNKYIGNFQYFCKFECDENGS